MSRKIDNRAVEMEFDNKQFEKGIKDSIKSLDDLKKALNLDSASKAFDSIDKAAKDVSFAGIEKGINAIADRFSVMGIVGMTVIQNLTTAAMQAAVRIANALTSSITSGGMQRALNIENAKFQIEGLGYSWEQVEKDISYGVKDTAYGLDAAAKAAGQLLASNVSVGESMRTALRGISGVAAMTNSEYEDISDIFITVAGNGRLMANELNRLSGRGINAAAALGKYLGKSEAEVRDMTSKGKIDFATFAAAMDDAFGAHAKEANKTFTGALSNVKAALSRLGASFATPYLDNARDVLNALIPAIDGVHSALGPIIKTASEAMSFISKFIVELIKGIDVVSLLADPVAKLDIILRGLGQSLLNIGSGLLTILTPIGEAIMEMVPKVSIENVKDFMDNFVKLTETFRIGENAANNLKRTFKGLFAVISMAAKVIGILLKALGGFLGLLIPIGRALLSFSANIGDFLVELNETISSVNLLTKVFDKLKDVLRPIVGVIKDVFNGISEALDQISRDGVLVTVASLFERFANAVSNALSVVLDKLKEFTSNFNFNELISVINAGLIGGVLGLIIKFVKGLTDSQKKTSIKDIINDIKEAFDDFMKKGRIAAFTDAIDSIRGALETFQMTIKANILLKIAAALFVMAVAVGKLSEIDAESLAKSLGALGVMLGELFGALSLFEKAMGGAEFASIVKVSFSMIGLATAVLILSHALERLSAINWSSLVKSLGAMAVVFKSLSNFFNKTDLAGVTIRSSIGIIALGVALNVFTRALEKLSAIPSTSILKSLGAMVVLLDVLSHFVNNVSGSTNLVSVGVGLTIVAAAMLIFNKAISELGALPIRQLGKGLLALGAALLLISNGLENMPTGSNMISTAVGLTIVASALLLIQRSLSELGSMSVRELGKGLLAMGSALLLLANGLEAMPDDTLKISASLLIMSLALNMISKSLIKLGGMSWEQMAIGLISLGGALAVISAGVAGMTEALPGAKALIVIAAALAILTPVLLTLGGMDIGSLAMALLTLAGVFGVFGLATIALEPIVSVMISLAGAIALLGVGCLGVGAGLLAFSAGLTALSVSGAAGIGALVYAIEALVNLIPTVIKAIGLGIVELFKVLTASVPEMIAFISAIIQSLLTAVIENVPLFMEAATTLITSFLTTIQTLLPMIIETGMTFLLTFLQGIRDNIFQVVVLAGEIIVNFLNGLATQLPMIIQAGFNLMISFLNGLADGIRNNMGLVMSAVGNVLTAIIQSAWSFLTSTIGGFLAKGVEIIGGVIDGIANGIGNVKDAFSKVIQSAVDTVKGFVDSFFSAAGDLIQGIVDGIKGGIAKVGEAVAGVANAAVDGFKNLLGIASPSKVFKKLGRFVVEGFVVGVNQFSYMVGPAVSKFANKAVSASKEAVSAFSSIFDEDVEFDDPTIKPVIDMTDVDNGLKSIDSKFSDMNAKIGVSGAMGNLTVIANNTKKNQEAAMAPTKTLETVVNNYEFNQTNNSPKPLSRSEIYRQTRNQISRFKEVTSTV